MVTNPEPGYAWLYYDAAAIYVGVSERALRRAVHAGKVEHCRIGLRVRFTQAMLDRWISGNIVGGAA